MKDKDTDKEKGENIGTCVACPFAACRNLLRQTYTSKPTHHAPRTMHPNSKDCCVTPDSHKHAEKAVKFSENNSRYRCYWQLKKTDK